MRLRFGEVVLDSGARVLRRGGDDVHLSPKALELLELLVARRPDAVAKQELYDALWPDTFVVEANLPVLIREVRSAIGDDAHEIIRTVHRFGYRFDAEVRELRDAPAGDPFVHLLVLGEQQFRLSGGENVVGRDGTADVVVPSTTVSRRHAIITISGPAATLTDLGSKNGTRLDGRAVSGSVALSDGAFVRFGSIEMTYRCSAPLGATETMEHSA